MKNKKNLLIVSPSKTGLTETFIKAHIERLHANVYYLYGYDLDFKDQNDKNLSAIYAPKPSFMAKLINFLPHYIYFRINKNRQKKRTREALIKRYLRENQIDAVLAEYGTSGSFIAPVCQALNIPLVVHFHGFDASVYKVLEEFKDGYRFMYDYASKIIVVSNAMKQALMNHGCEASKIVVNPCGPHDIFLDIQPNFSSNSIVAVGRHTYKKAPYLTILAFQKVLVKHPNLKLVMVGTGEIFEVSKHMVESLGLQEKIILPGGLPREDIIKYLEQSFLFVQHSVVAENGDSEGMPVGIMEAMAAGLPVVSTRHGGIPDVVIENETGFLVDEGDVDAMATYIINIVEDRKLAEKMGNKSKRRIADKYTMAQHLETIAQVLELED